MPKIIYWMSFLFIILGYPGKTEEYVPFSLFFSAQELNVLRKLKEQNQVPRESTKIYLSTFFFLSPSIWTLWVNDHQINPMQGHPFLKVCHITSQEVTFDWHHDNEVHHFTLKPNQSYNARTRQIKEGRGSSDASGF